MTDERMTNEVYEGVELHYVKGSPEEIVAVDTENKRGAKLRKVRDILHPWPYDASMWDDATSYTGETILQALDYDTGMRVIRDWVALGYRELDHDNRSYA